MDGVVSVESDLRFVRERLAHQQRLLHAMWSLMQEKLGCTEADLRSLVEKAAARATEGSKIAATCAQCGRHLQDNVRICLYCGAEHKETPLFWG
jgi:uncharacterized tellurite resistance protein B-like protein